MQTQPQKLEEKIVPLCEETSIQDLIQVHKSYFDHQEQIKMNRLLQRSQKHPNIFFSDTWPSCSNPSVSPTQGRRSNSSHNEHKDWSRRNCRADAAVRSGRRSRRVEYDRETRNRYQSTSCSEGIGQASDEDKELANHDKKRKKMESLEEKPP